MPPTLHIRLLGEFGLFCDDAPLTTVNTPRLQSLLAYLVLHRDAPQPRQQIAFLLWPDSSEAQARTNLRNLIHQLRQALPQAEEFLCATANTLQWRADAPFTLDVAEFENALAQGALQQAVDLYRGDLNPSCYDDWIAPERERLQQRYVSALERLIQQLEDKQDYRAAIESAQRLLRYDPLREETYRWLMRLCALNGDRTGVARAYDTCITVLRRELSLEPNTETREAYERYIKLPASVRQGAELVPSVRAGTRFDNLPHPLTRFIGREREISEVKQLIAAQRLVTLTGAGGVGKTRLAIQAARELLADYAQGVWLAELASVAHPRLVPQAVASVWDVREEQGRPLLSTLADYLREKTLLLVLDNCEHVIQACAQLAEHLLHYCPNLRILATSREMLHVEGEFALRVPSLSLPPVQPPTRKVLEQSEAARLFLEPAAIALPSFELTDTNALAVAQICWRLDGIPLAIELAAAWVKMLKVEQIVARLDDAFRLLTSGSRTALPRQQTLHATIDWSHALLSKTERACFRRLAVFAGSWTLEAAEAVCSSEGVETCEVLDLLSQLGNKSLLVIEREPGQEARYHLLETIRQYAWEKLREADEQEENRAQHLSYYLKLAQEVEPKLYGAQQLEGLAQLDAEQSNIRAALEWGVEGGLEAGGRLAAALFWYWNLRVDLGEC